jgi:AraC-like DNA-binding protein
VALSPFNSLGGSFDHSFKGRFGMTPRQYRERAATTPSER